MFSSVSSVFRVFQILANSGQYPNIIQRSGNMQSLYQDYEKFEKIMKKVKSTSKTIDTTGENFLAPTTLIPLLCEQEKREIPIVCNDNTFDYVKRIIRGEETNTNTPYQILPKSAQERQDKELSVNMMKKIDSQYGGRYTLAYLFAELTNNIYDHTPFEEELASQGYTYAQEYPKLKKLDLCVMDDGLSIPGRFEKSGIDFDDPCHAIEIAISHHSTAPEDKDTRGDGLWSTIRLVVEGNRGNVLIVSGKGCLHILSKERYRYYLLNNEDIFKGTLISMRLNHWEVQDHYSYIDGFPGNPYAYNKSKRKKAKL